MKYLIVVAVSLVLFAGCKNGGENFTVSGKITNPSADSIYLEELSYTTPETKKLDSAKIDKNGNYTLKGSSAQQNLFMIGFKDNPAVILVNDTKDIKIDFEPNGLQFPEVKSSDATKELYAFIKDYFQKDSALAVIYQQLNALTEETAKDTNYVRNLRQDYTTRISALSSLLSAAINRSKNPAVICFVLDRAKGAIAPQDLSALAESAAKRFPQHTGLASFKTELAKQVNPNANYPLLNQQAPDLTMASPDGKKISVSNYKGKYLLVDFWASWCAPCRQENPNVVEAYNKFKNKNFDILGVSLDDDKTAWLKAIQDDHLAWTHISDLRSPSAAASLYHFDGIPFNVLIDPQGKIIASGLRGPALEQKLSEVLQ
ncbi:redoxin domain-containing protein [Parafilimonas sp.]|uniref:redoxin domain-containing protein n=1 Tax=Parafilimonas sp. TaxID=1969739 RepID=UPI0039E48AC3